MKKTQLFHFAQTMIILRAFNIKITKIENRFKNEINETRNTIEISNIKIVKFEIEKIKQNFNVLLSIIESVRNLKNFMKKMQQ